jgi:sugar lactone lactonase YvrE
VTPAGVLDGVLDVPVRNVTSCALGGTGPTDLFVTAASRGLSPAQLAEQEHAGGIFRGTPGAAGLEPKATPTNLLSGHAHHCDVRKDRGRTDRAAGR